MSNLANAQKNPDIAGLYNLGSSSPEGGSHLFVLKNGTYAITYFGGIQIGKWNVKEGNTFKFTPNLKESRFELFGRKNKHLKGNTKIFFNGFENSETFIQLRTGREEAQIMQRVFNSGANCFSYPYVYTFKTVANSISFLAIQYGATNNPLITIKNPDGYNDFVVNFVEVDRYEAEAFLVNFKDNKLYQVGETDFSERTPIDEVGEDLVFIKRFIEMESNKDTIYLNPSYNMFGQPDRYQGKHDIHEHHVFDAQKNAFIDATYYTEGEENTLSAESFGNMSLLYAYKALKAYAKKSAKYKINEKPLFEVHCD